MDPDCTSREQSLTAWTPPKCLDTLWIRKIESPIIITEEEPGELGARPAVDL
jgi:hypothetical protein